MDDPIGDDPALQNLDVIAQRVAERGGAVHLTGLRGSARAVAGAHLVRLHGERPALFVAPNAKACDALVADLRAALEIRKRAGASASFRVTTPIPMSASRRNRS